MKKITLSYYKLLIILISISIIIMLFLPALSFENSDTYFKGYELIFGTELINLGIFGSGQIEPNILIGMAYLLPLIALFVVVLQEKEALIALILFAIAAMLFFLVPEISTVTFNNTDIDVSWTMAYGLYLAIGLSLFGALLSGFEMITNSRKK